MNYIILYTVGVIRKINLKQKRLILSSTLGSFYAILVYLNIMNFTSNFFMKILLSISMTFLAFNSKTPKNLLKDLLLFYITSFVFGGCAFAFIYLIQPNKVQMNHGVLVGTYPLKVTLIAGIIAFFTIQLAFKITKNKLSVNDMICSIMIYEGENHLTLKALIDSGNLLKEPISRRTCNCCGKKQITKTVF